MTIKIDFPGAIGEHLQKEYGGVAEFQTAATQMLALSWYQQGFLSLGQIATWLNHDVYTMAGILKQHRIPMNYSEADLQHDLEVSQVQHAP